MKTLQVLLFVVATSMVSFCAPGGVLAGVRKIQIDPTVVEQPAKVKDPVAAKLILYDLRAAVRDALIEEGNSPIRAHFVLDEFSSEGAAKRLTSLGTGRHTSTVDGRLVIQDAGGMELASVRIRVHGTVAFSSGKGYNTAQGPQAASDFEQRLHEELERLK